MPAAGPAACGAASTSTPTTGGRHLRPLAVSGISLVFAPLAGEFGTSCTELQLHVRAPDPRSSLQRPPAIPCLFSAGLLPVLRASAMRDVLLLDKVTCPFFVMHGQRDDIIPFYHGLRLHKAERTMSDYSNPHHNSFQACEMQYQTGAVKYKNIYDVASYGPLS